MGKNNLHLRDPFLKNIIGAIKNGSGAVFETRYIQIAGKITELEGDIVYASPLVKGMDARVRCVVASHPLISLPMRVGDTGLILAPSNRFNNATGLTDRDNQDLDALSPANLSGCLFVPLRFAKNVEPNSLSRLTIAGAPGSKGVRIAWTNEGKSVLDINEKSLSYAQGEDVSGADGDSDSPQSPDEVISLSAEKSLLQTKQYQIKGEEVTADLVKSLKIDSPDTSIKGNVEIDGDVTVSGAFLSKTAGANEAVTATISYVKAVAPPGVATMGTLIFEKGVLVSFT